MQYTSKADPVHSFCHARIAKTTLLTDISLRNSSVAASCSCNGKKVYI